MSSPHAQFKKRLAWVKKQPVDKKSIIQKQIKWNPSGVNKGKGNGSDKKSMSKMKQTIKEIADEKAFIQFCKNREITPHPNTEKQSIKSTSTCEEVENGDFQLLNVMKIRLKQCAQTSIEQERMIKHQIDQINELKATNSILKATLPDSTMMKYVQMKEIKRQNRKLKQKAKEIEQFLNKNGVKYVGGQIVGEFNAKKIKEDIKNAKTNYRMPEEIDFSTICQRINQLNESLREQTNNRHIHTVNNVMTFANLPQISIQFYENGILIQGYPFFPYNEGKSIAILSDLVDGYWPSVLKQKYCNGVLMHVKDSLTLKYHDKEESPWKGGGVMIY